MERELWQYLKTAKKPIVLYGMGNGADKIINVLEENGIEFKGVFASDGFVREKYFHGHKICSYRELRKKFGEMIVLLCFGSARPEVRENVLKIAAEQELYAPEVPVIGGGLFNESFYKENKADFDFVYDRLADEPSKNTFINVIKYKLSGKIDYLLDCETDDDELFDTVLKLSNDESFLDLGAYTGDTVLDFVGRVDGYEKIIAAEPDVKNFKKLVLNTESLENIRCENVGISDACKTASFNMKSGRNSSAGSGGTEIIFKNVDTIVKEERITFVKMDVEGEEKKAILGARETILRYKPKMNIACYHRTEDLIALPKAVLDIRDDYKIYIRHFRSLPAWDTNFYFV